MSLFTLILLIGVLYIPIARLSQKIIINKEFQPCSDTDSHVEILLVANGGHTDLVFPIQNKQNNWANFIPTNDFKQDDHQYISIGWGERAFYLEAGSWDNLKPITAIKALTGFNKTLMKVILYNEKPTEQEQQTVTSIKTTPEAYDKLIQHIQSQFDTDQEQQVQKITNKGVDCCKGFNYNFYAARGRYFFFKNCNCWVNRALKVSGIKTPIWAPFTDSLTYPLQQQATKRTSDLSFFGV